MNRAARSGQNNEWPQNLARAQWAASAVLKFARATGVGEDLYADPETVLADLLADVMHWCDGRNTYSRLTAAVDFESALGRARHHYRQECARERTGRPEDPHAP
jgi:hypothetical protein